MARVLRGEVRWVRAADRGGPAAAGASDRAVLILSEDVFNESSGTAICAAVVSAEPPASYPLFLKLGSRALPRPTWVCLGHVQTIPTDRIGGRAGRATAAELALVVDGLNEIVSR